jgi:hypothetical protein
MSADNIPSPIAVAAARAALARMYIELAVAFHTSTFPLGQEPDEMDANLVLVAVAVMLGHAEGNPMTARCIENLLHMPHSTTARRLDALVERGIIAKRADNRYVLDPDRAERVPYLDAFNLILSRGYAVIGPHLVSVSDK